VILKIVPKAAMTSTSWRIFPASNEGRMLEKIVQWQRMKVGTEILMQLSEKNMIFIFFSSTWQPENLKPSTIIKDCTD
jgi:hypothetical protein